MAISVGYAHWQYNADVASPHATRGWCWAEGEVQEFTGAHSLREDVLWLTNLPWQFYVALGVHEHRHIKPNYFLPVPLDCLVTELNIDQENQNHFANTIAVLGARLVHLAMRHYGMGVLKACLDSNTFAQAIATCVGHHIPNLTASEPCELRDKIIWSNLTPYATLERSVERSDCAVLRAPFFDHAKAVLSCPLPSESEPWEEVNVAHPDRMEFVKTADVPMVVEVLGSALTGTLNTLYDLSSGPLRWSRKRRWLASNELIFLAENGGAFDLGRIFIQRSGYVCDAMTWSMPHAGDALHLSLSAGLLSHAHWLSGAIPLAQRYWPIRSMWLRSADRMQLACRLFALQGISGLNIVCYGEGAVYIKGPEDSVQEAIRRAPHIGLSPTQSTWAASKDRNLSLAKDWLPDSCAGFTAAHYRLSTRPVADLLRLDQAAISSLTDERAAIQAISEILKEVRNV